MKLKIEVLKTFLSVLINNFCSIFFFNFTSLKIYYIQKDIFLDPLKKIILIDI
jgi:hypothetical protein